MKYIVTYKQYNVIKYCYDIHINTGKNLDWRDSKDDSIAQNFNLRTARKIILNSKHLYTNIIYSEHRILNI